MFDLLLSLGASLDAVNRRGLTPLTLAATLGRSKVRSTRLYTCFINSLVRKENNSATSNNMNLIHWPLWVCCYIWYIKDGTAGPQPTQVPRCTKCNSPPINGQCTN